MLLNKYKLGFTLVELLVVVSIISVLLAVLIPALALARKQAMAVVCMSNIRQIGLVLPLYGQDYNNYAIPSCDPQTETYWWGTKREDGIDHKAGYVWPYLGSDIKKKSVYECPSQPYGTYRLQGKSQNVPDDPKWITSTYGYNGYYLCPPKSAWLEIQHRPWQKLTTVISPGRVIAFADAMLDWDYTGQNPQFTNIALLDPPYLLSRNGMYWERNRCPTTSFRHRDRTNAAFVDGHAESMTTEGSSYTSPKAKIGSVGTLNAPHYVPDYLQWPKQRKRF